MVTCKDCLHAEVCEEYGEVFSLIKGGKCSLFKDRSQFVELSHAEWVEDEDMYGDPIYRCSDCDEHFILEEGTPVDNGYFYCPNCGAKMSKERENND